jgi:predicted nuclease with TOPRIM domain
VWQSIRLQREPFETEINEEVEKEYQQLEGERAGEEQSAEKSIAEMATRMEELEAKLDASNERLEAKIDASQSRLEAMFQQLLAARSAMNCTPPRLSERQLPHRERYATSFGRRASQLHEGEGNHEP